MTMRVTVEVLPNGDENRKFKVGIIEFDNISDLSLISDYRIRAHRFLKDREVETETVVTGVTRFNRTRGWAHLLRLGLGAIIARDETFAAFDGPSNVGTRHE